MAMRRADPRSRWPSMWEGGNGTRPPTLGAMAQPVEDEWRHEAACVGEDPELFFPIGSTGPALEQIEAAKQVCNRCPVRTECLEFALDTNQDSGVWGGTSEDKRRTARRRRARRRRRGKS